MSSETIREYKCPCCGAALSFGAAEQKMKCAYCDSEISLDTYAELAAAAAENPSIGSKYDWDSYVPRDYSAVEAEGLASYICPSCGAEVTGDETMAATVCPYCGNATIVKKQFEGTLRPDFIIPFKIDKQTAMARFEEAAKKAPFLPNLFKDKKKIEEMAGVYVPFWTFDCDCNANMSFKATRTSSWSDSRYIYTKTDTFRVLRQGSVGFEKLPVDGSQKADDAYMEALAPYDFSEAVDFHTAYLSGFLADKYDVSAEESRPRANELVKRSTERAFASTVSGYATVVPENSEVSFSDGRVRYSLLPVWMLNIQYEGQNYRYAINGQTGKTVGAYPIDKKKETLYRLKTFGISFAVCVGILLIAAAIGLL